jgi:1-pyrroline-5-carboxylate dehydrogenase
MADHLDTYRSYPRIVGETGGKDFVVAHRSADPAGLVTGLVRGAFEYQGQKCSAASRAYISRGLWENGVREQLVDATKSLSYGDVTDFGHFGGAVIDARAFAKHKGVLLMASATTNLEILAGGTADDSVGYFVQPTVVLGTDPTNELFTTEWFGPILAVHVFDDSDYGKVLELVDTSTPYALTGAVFATDRSAIEEAHRTLRFAAGNFYVNDKPTGAVVGQQPFGGSRGSGTNDKAGSIFNLQRWVSPRSVKETFVPPTEHGYPHMG